ncbi:hypothetical protein H6G93_02185 [Nostoc sp. FACHB-973]|nr:hypothetical protein [Nostoc sp. FACHB-973]MBX9252573.1 hypothetical protein [Desmonostoc muscorum CCALA 125]
MAISYEAIATVEIPFWILDFGLESLSKSRLYQSSVTIIFQIGMNSQLWDAMSDDKLLRVYAMNYSKLLMAACL